VSALLSFAIAPTRAWTALYTRGLPSRLRSERREEIDCDLWEHQRLADLEREPVTDTAAAILLRLIMGVPADMTWRLEAGADARSGKGTQMNDSWIMRGVWVAALLVALAPVGLGISTLAGGGEWDSTFERIAASLLWIATGLAMGAGPRASGGGSYRNIGHLVLGSGNHASDRPCTSSDRLHPRWTAGLASRRAPGLGEARCLPSPSL